MGNNENRTDNHLWSIALPEKAGFNCLDESKVLQSSLKTLITSSWL